ncbi:hypothetical protein B0H10DRAFT_2187958 [Mycena sp. CBHHK59/15]|nr:hypothetical protein B0H10DRAFT_2187958 [Mycena sp. CBHHK59/15]
MPLSVSSPPIKTASHIKTAPDSAPTASQPIKVPKSVIPHISQSTEDTLSMPTVSSHSTENAAVTSGASAAGSSSSVGRAPTTRSSTQGKTSGASTARGGTANSGGTKSAAAPPASLSGHDTSTSGAVNSPKTSFTGTTTSTITDAPESTLSKPSFIPTVINGKTSFSAPPLVTVLSTSRESNGSFVTFTHVVANPTGFDQAVSGGSSEGAVAGVFVVIGAIFTCIVAFGVFYLCRRRRRARERHRSWLVSVNRPRPMAEEPQDPFDDPQVAPSPPIRVVPKYGHDSQPQTPLHEKSTEGLGLYQDTPTRHFDNQVDRQRPYSRMESEENHEMGEIGLAISANQSKPSLAQSSPSIYPPSLPPVNDDPPFIEEEVRQQTQRYSDSSVAPPRPRRSHLRDAVFKPQLITPPSSVSSHRSVSDYASPWALNPMDDGEAPQPQYGHRQLHDIIGRQTLLDVCVFAALCCRHLTLEFRFGINTRMRLALKRRG